MEYLELILHELVHLILSLLAAIVLVIRALHRKSKHVLKMSLIILAGALLGGVWVDVDHLFEHFVVYGLRFHLDDFLRGYAFDKLGQLFIVFHAWEWVMALAVIVYFIKNRYVKYFLMSLALGLLSHLLYDSYSNEISILGYSFFYRLAHGFDLNYLQDY